MAKESIKKSEFDFGAAISQLFAHGGERNFTIRLVLWTGAFFGLIFALLAKPYFAFIGKLVSAGWIANKYPNDTDAILGAYAGLLSYVLPMILATLAIWMIYAAAETALHKRSLKNIDHGFMPLRFGKDELRVMGSQFVVFLICMVVLIGFELLAIILIAGAIAAGGVHILLGALVGILALLAVLAFFIIPIHVSIRLAPAAALSVKRERFAPLAGWPVTRKRTAYLFLAYLFVYIAGYVVMFIIQMAVLGALFSENYMLLIMGFSEQNPQDIFAQAAEKLKNPSVILTLVIGGIVYILLSVTWWLSMAGIPIYVVKWWEKDVGDDTKHDVLLSTDDGS